MRQVTGRRVLGSAGVLALTLGALSTSAAPLSPSASAPQPTPQPSMQAAPTPTPTWTSPSAPGATLPGDVPAVLGPLPTNARPPTGAGLARVLGPLLRAGSRALGGSVSAEVVDVRTDASLFALSPGRAAVAASSAKLLTAAAALSRLGPDATISTRVVDGLTPAEIVLVGGGDVLLSAGSGDRGGVIGRAGLADLAARTAATLRAHGRTTVAVRLDDSLFRGPAVNPLWGPGAVEAGFVAPVMALEVAEGIVPGRRARSADPAMDAAQRFAALLAARGVRVSGPVVRSRVPASSAVLGDVESAPIAQVVELALADSDNTVAEALARLVAVHLGRPPTFTDSGVAVADVVGALGVPVAGVHLSGGSGLSLSAGQVALLGTAGLARNKLTPAAAAALVRQATRVPVRTLTRVLVLAASDAHEELRAVLTGLPVAAASGTLAGRFAIPGERPAAGVVRAKTGTLTGVSALAGTVVDADGRLLAFAILADAVPKNGTLAARRALDDVAAALAACGC